MTTPPTQNPPLPNNPNEPDPQPVDVPRVDSVSPEDLMVPAEMASLFVLNGANLEAIKEVRLNMTPDDTGQEIEPNTGYIVRDFAATDLRATGTIPPKEDAIDSSGDTVVDKGSGLRMFYVLSDGSAMDSGYRFQYVDEDTI